MISNEKELDIDNKLYNYLKITGILNNVFIPQKDSYENKNKITQYTGPPSYMAAKLGLLKQGRPEE
jgi:hypothetical protein